MSKASNKSSIQRFFGFIQLKGDVLRRDSCQIRFLHYTGYYEGVNELFIPYRLLRLILEGACGRRRGGI
jgi:hypothetical protein